MVEGNRKPEAGEVDPDKMVEQLEVELMMKRGAWQQAKSRRSNLRMLSFGFLFLVIIAALFAFFMFFVGGNAEEMRARAAQQSEATPSPTESPR